MGGRSLERPEDRYVRELREAAERAVTAMVDSLAVAGLPPLPSLYAGRVTLLPELPGGIHIELGGCNIRTLLAISHHIAAHARCTGRIVPGRAMPAGLAELPFL